MADNGFEVLESREWASGQPSGADEARFLVRLGQENKARLIDLPAAWGKYAAAFWNPRAGKLELLTAELGPTDYVAGSLESLAEMTIDLRSGATRVFVDFERVETRLNAEGKSSRDRILLPLEQTQQLLTLRLIDGEWQTQAEMIRVLRDDLCGCDETQLLRRVRAMRLASGKDASRDLGVGNASVSSSVKASVLLGDEAPPEYVSFRVPTFEAFAGDPHFKQEVRCSFDIDLDSGKLRIKALAGQFAALEQVACALIVTKLRNLLREAAVPVWLGRVAGFQG